VSGGGARLREVIFSTPGVRALHPRYNEEVMNGMTLYQEDEDPWDRLVTQLMLIMATISAYVNLMVYLRGQ
jgi:hypothetical protein